MEVRILCLHGMRDNAEIFRAQTESIRSMLPSSFSFTFANAPELCEPHPAAADFYSGPFRCWYPSPSTSRVARAHEIVHAITKKHGEFHVVMGFSQGASLAASMILHHQLKHPDAPPLFGAAIFFGSPLPFSHSLNQGIDSRLCFGLTGPRLEGRPTAIPEYLIPSDASFLEPNEDEPDTCSDSASSSDTDDGRISDARWSSSLKNQGPFYQMFHHTVDKVRINIPTAHIYGRHDPWRMHSMDLVKLCQAETSYVYEHDGGHEIPRDDTEDICDIIEMAIFRALL